ADRADGGPRREHLDLVVEDLPLGRQHLHAERRVGHQSFFVAATTSSIVPLSRNADSGTSSCWPSRISLKPRIVSAIGTYAPDVPVNCSATWKGCERKRSMRRARPTISL